MFCIIKLLMRVLCNKVVGCCTYIYIFVCVYMRVNWLECCKIIGQVLAVRTSRILASLVRRTSENNSLFLSLIRWCPEVIISLYLSVMTGYENICKIDGERFG